MSKDLRKLLRAAEKKLLRVTIVYSPNLKPPIFNVQFIKPAGPDPLRQLT